MTDQTTPATGADGTTPSAPETASAEELWAEFDAADTSEAGQPQSRTRASEEDEDGNVTHDTSDEGSAPSEDPDLPKDGQTAASDKPDAKTPSSDDRDAQLARLQHQLKSERGRREAAQRELARLQSRVADGTQDVTERKRSLAASSKRQAQIDKAKADYPDAVAPLADELTEAQKRESREIKRQEKQLQQDTEALNALLVENQTRFLEEHADGFDFVKEHWDTFKDWIEDQPRAVRDGFNQNRKAIVDPIGAAHTVALFKQAMGKLGGTDGQGKGGSGDPKKPPLDGKRQRQLQGAQSPRTTQALRTQSAPSDNASAADHWAYFEALDREKERHSAR